MPINLTNKPQVIGILILFVGVTLLAFTFINAYLFLQEPLRIVATSDLAEVFGDALAPLIQACVRLMYLGVMGWISSLLTVRSIPLITHKQLIRKSTTKSYTPQQGSPTRTRIDQTNQKLQSETATSHIPETKKKQAPPKASVSSGHKETEVILVPPEE
jgi:hypothetical protein